MKPDKQILYTRTLYEWFVRARAYVYTCNGPSNNYYMFTNLMTAEMLIFITTLRRDHFPERMNNTYEILHYCILRESDYQHEIDSSQY